MSGGRLVVLDRLGRDVRFYPLKEGLATLGSDPVCDIRVVMPSVSPHHATVIVHPQQTVVQSVSGGETLVNGAVVSVAALRHGDEIELGGRRLRWEYSPQPAPTRRTSRTPRPTRPRRPVSMPVHRESLVAPHRASMPASSSGKQVAIVQPQRRDNNDQNESAARASKRSRSRHEPDPAEDADSSKRWSKSESGAESATTASMWIESRKVPRRTPQQRASQRTPHRKSRHTPQKIEEPQRIDHTKQAALLLMAGRARPPTLAVKAARRSRGTRSTPSRPSRPDRSITARQSNRSQQSLRTDISMDTDSELNDYPVLASPKKSALKNPTARKSGRKTESIKFDLSNLEHNRSSDVILINETKEPSSVSESMTLHYSDTSAQSSPRKSNSRSSRILDKLGTSVTQSVSEQTLTPASPKRKSARSSFILKKALENSRTISRLSRNSNLSYSSTMTSIRKTRSPRASNLESYSIVDLVSLDSNESSNSVYNSVASTDNMTFDSPQTVATRSRSTNVSFLASTPYDKTKEITPSTSTSNKKRGKRSTSLITPENTQNHLSFNSAKISKASKSRSRINESELLLVDEEDDSPRSSRKKSNASSPVHKNISISASYLESPEAGAVTPENQNSPEEVGTPVLSIQSLIDQSSLNQSSLNLSQNKRKVNLKRKTIGVPRSVKRARATAKSKSFSISRISKKKATDEDEKIVTPKSSVKLVQEAVKNKHSSARKSVSKRSIIDTLNESDFVKKLFNSPVKRKLSQSMTEFSRRQLFDDDDVVSIRPTRNTVALTGRTPDNSFLENSEAFTPEVFVSPLSTPSNSPNLAGIKRLYAQNSPENDLRDLRGVKSLFRTPRARKSIKNDLTNVSGVKEVFARSPKNRLSDVRVKEVFVAPPNNDLSRVSGVKKLFESRKRKSVKAISPELTGIRSLYKRKPRNDLRNVSGVKSALQIRSPKNDLSNVKSIKHMFREDQEAGISDVSGVEELFKQSQTLDSTFDQLIGRPPIRSYGKSKSLNVSTAQASRRKARSLRYSIDLITNNVEQWLQEELSKSMHKETSRKSANRSASNITRELQNLNTDTVSEASGRASRARNTSNLTAEVSQKKSASELYSARKLPIKKRSFMNASANKTNLNRTNRLPIKKRLVVHSTPVKGAVNLTMNTTELARVSPIAVEKKMELNTGATISEVVPQEKKTRGKKAANVNEPEVVETVNISPKKTRARVKPVTPVQRVIRGRRTAEPKIKNKRASLVITKKPPVLSPKHDPNSRNEESAPKRVRATRQYKLVEKLPTPKKTRGKAQKVTFVVIKPSPQRKPSNIRTAKKSETLNSETENITANKRTRGKGQESQPNFKSNRKNKTKDTKEISVEPVKKGRRTQITKDETQDAPVEPVTRRGRETTNVVNETVPNKKRKTELKIEAELDTQTKSTRRNRTQSKTVIEISKTQVQPVTKSQTKSEAAKTKTANKRQTKAQAKRQNETEAAKNQTKSEAAKNKRQTKSQAKQQNESEASKTQVATKRQTKSQAKQQNESEASKTQVATKRQTKSQAKQQNESEASKTIVATKRQTKSQAKQQNESEASKTIVATKRQTKSQAKQQSESEASKTIVATKRHTKSQAKQQNELEASKSQTKSEVQTNVRGRRRKVTITEVSVDKTVQGRRAKVNVEAAIEKKVPKRGRNVEDKNEKVDMTVERPQETRSRRTTAKAEVEVKTTRGKKAQAEPASVAGPKGRKRKTIVEESGAKEATNAAKKQKTSASPRARPPAAADRERRSRRRR